MEINKRLEICINSLNNTEVKGKQNLNNVLLVIQVLEDIIKENAEATKKQ